MVLSIRLVQLDFAKLLRAVEPSNSCNCASNQNVMQTISSVKLGQNLNKAFLFVPFPLKERSSVQKGSCVVCILQYLQEEGWRSWGQLADLDGLRSVPALQPDVPNASAPAGATYFALSLQFWLLRTVNQIPQLSVLVPKLSTNCIFFPIRESTTN